MHLPMAPIMHMLKRVHRSASISLSSFLSIVLLLDGTFIAFIMTCNFIHAKEKKFKNNPEIWRRFSNFSNEKRLYVGNIKIFNNYMRKDYLLESNKIFNS